MTLSEYKLTQQPGSPADRYLDSKIAQSSADEKVLACHCQVMGLLDHLNKHGREESK